MGSKDKWGPMTREDLAGWSDLTAGLVLEATAAGWVGRVSSKGHIVMRAPDGETTLGMGREEGKRAYQNNLAAFRRWQRATAPQDEGTFSLLDAELGDRPLRTMLEHVELDVETMTRLQELWERLDYDADALEKRLLFVASEEDPERWYVLDLEHFLIVGHGPGIAEEEIWTERMLQETVLPDHEPADEPADERPHVCEDCGRTFRRPMHLGRHRSAVHPEPVPEIELPDWSELEPKVQAVADALSLLADALEKAYEQIGRLRERLAEVEEDSARLALVEEALKA